MRTVRFIDIALCFLRNRKGIASVEFVLILPVLVVFLFGTIEIGRVLHDYHVVVKGVRDGTRYLSRVAVDCPGGVGTVGSFVNASDEQRGENLTMTGSINLTPTLPADYLLAAWAPPLRRSPSGWTAMTRPRLKGFIRGAPLCPLSP